MSASRRTARLRREYLYKKSLEGEERADYERKEKVKAALAAGKPIPTELQKEAQAIKASADLDDVRTAKPRSHIDDEYAGAGGREPKVCITTSRDPSSRLRAFAVEMKLVFPGSARINRGNTTTKEIFDAARGADFTDVVLLTETRGEPDGLTISHLPYGPSVHFSLSGTVLRHDIEGRGTVSEAAPHLVFHGLGSTLGDRIKCVLQHMFPVPKPDSKRVMTFANDSDYISFRHHTWDKAPGASSGRGEALKKADVVLNEVGPRFELRPYKIVLGTLDQPDAETEWVLRPYMNTARKKAAL